MYGDEPTCLHCGHVVVGKVITLEDDGLIDQIGPKLCPMCGAVLADRRNKTCSRSCAGVARWKRREEKQAKKRRKCMDWAVKVKLQFPKEGITETADQARAYAKAVLERCIREEYLTHYHVLSEPRQVDA